MTTFRACVSTMCLAAALILPAAAHGQVDPVPAPERQRQGPVVRIGQGYALAAGGEVEEIVVVGGDVTIEGRVDGDLVVVLGNVSLSSAAVVGGDLVVVGGGAVIAPGATVSGDLVVVGGTLDAPPRFAPGGDQVSIGAPAVGSTVRAVAPWVGRGLLWGRPIVPDLGWVWLAVGFLFLLYAALNAIFDGPVRACADVLGTRPLTAFLAGLLVLLLVAPVSLLLVMSVAGVFVVPFLYCAIFVAWIVGKVAVARRLGMSVVPEGAEAGRLQALRSLTIGSAAIVLVYMVPALGFVAWALIGVFGLGAAALALLAAYRLEHPAPPASDTLPPPTPLLIRRDDASAADATAAQDLPIAPGLQASVPAAAPADLASFPRASFSQRLAAFVLDIVLVAIVAHLVRPVIDGSDHAFPLLLLAYHIGFWAWKGTTVGGIICHLRVTRVNGLPLRFSDAAVRGLSSIFSIAVLGLGCFWILRDPERQSWHDRIAGTYVVTVPANWPL